MILLPVLFALCFVPFQNAMASPSPDWTMLALESEAGSLESSQLIGNILRQKNAEGVYLLKDEANTPYFLSIAYAGPDSAYVTLSDESFVIRKSYAYVYFDEARNNFTASLHVPPGQNDVNFVLRFAFTDDDQIYVYDPLTLPHPRRLTGRKIESFPDHMQNARALDQPIEGAFEGMVTFTNGTQQLVRLRLLNVTPEYSLGRMDWGRFHVALNHVSPGRSNVIYASTGVIEGDGWIQLRATLTEDNVLVGEMIGAHGGILARNVRLTMTDRPDF